MGSRKTRRNVIPSSSCRAHHGKDFLENKTHKELVCAPPQQGNKEHGMGHLPWMVVSLRQNQLCGLWGTNEVYCCGGTLKQVRPWQCHPSVFILLAADKHTEVSGQIRQLVSVFLPRMWNSYSSQSNGQWKTWDGNRVYTWANISLTPDLACISMCPDQHSHLSSSLIFTFLLA